MLYKQQLKKALGQRWLEHVELLHWDIKLNLLPSMWNECREMTSMTMFMIYGKRRHTRLGRNPKAVGATTPRTNSDGSWWRSKNIGKRASTQSWLGTKQVLENWSWTSVYHADIFLKVAQRCVTSPDLSTVLSQQLLSLLQMEKNFREIISYAAKVSQHSLSLQLGK